MTSDDEVLHNAVAGIAAHLPAMRFVLLDVERGAANIDDCRAARAAGSVVVVICASDDELTAVAAFDAGADDVISRPIRPQELHARLRAHARHHEVRSDLLHVDADARTVSVAGHQIAVSALEFDLLVVLTSKPGHTFTRRDLRELCWDAHAQVGPRVVDGVMTNVRRKLGPAAGTIESVRGAGYRFSGRPTSSRPTSSR